MATLTEVEAMPTTTAHRVVLPQQVEAIIPLVYEFHRRSPYLPYPLIYSLQMLPKVIGQPEHIVLAATEGDKPVGYLWAQVSAIGDAYINQLLSLTLAAGRALDDAGLEVSRVVGIRQWEGMFSLRPEEIEAIARVVPRYRAYHRRFGMKIRALWVFKPVEMEQ